MPGELTLNLSCGNKLPAITTENAKHVSFNENTSYSESGSSNEELTNNLRKSNQTIQSVIKASGTNTNTGTNQELSSQYKKDKINDLLKYPTGFKIANELIKNKEYKEFAKVVLTANKPKLALKSSVKVDKQEQAKLRASLQSKVLEEIQSLHISKHPAVVDLAKAISHNKPINSVDKLYDDHDGGNETLLMLLITSGENIEKIVEYLLNEASIDCNKTNDTGETALMLCAYAQPYSEKVLSALLVKSSINTQDKSGSTALMHAIMEENEAMVASLLKHKDIDLSISRPKIIYSDDESDDINDNESVEVNDGEMENARDIASWVENLNINSMIKECNNLGLYASRKN